MEVKTTTVVTVDMSKSEEVISYLGCKEALIKAGFELTSLAPFANENTLFIGINKSLNTSKVNVTFTLSLEGSK
ncbi:hypothetical protein COM90_23050 [Bacillus thuringiensis]|uniref:Uncharacterized protein n=1 Tax=Bacillus thuringiensis TaxID=1428 RepID=A0AB36TRY3_BACTU|nr:MULTISPECIES: hypothetical protein [Bacillus cereus group]AVP48418.1 hypothetical protein C2I25_26625 [Bacillus cereus]PEE86408.1 hypothetical protein COM90_23050 [Bacillus thuringiensis]PFM87834.1 hypothetical protein COJ61_22815 [Bacillus thuringiensis]